MNHAVSTLPQTTRCALLTALALPLLLGACADSSDGGKAACGNQQNLLRDTDFANLQAPRAQREWRSSQHSGDISFSYQAEDGVMTITQTGDEPWFVIEQSIGGSDWAGRKIRFSADLKLALTPPDPPHSFRQGGGLSLIARKGGRVVLSSQFEHQPHQGQHDWQRISVTREIPAGADSLRVGFQHQASGSLQVRDPSLVILQPGCS